MLPGTAEEPCWGPGNGGNQLQQQPPCFPEFRQNNQLSFPLIYSYLASTEEQVSASHFDQHRPAVQYCRV